MKRCVRYTVAATGALLAQPALAEPMFGHCMANNGTEAFVSEIIERDHTDVYAVRASWWVPAHDRGMGQTAVCRAFYAERSRAEADRAKEIELLQGYYKVIIVRERFEPTGKTFPKKPPAPASKPTPKQIAPTLDHPALTIQKVGPTPAEAQAERAKRELETQRVAVAANAKRIADTKRNEAATKAQLDKFMSELKKRGRAQ